MVSCHMSLGKPWYKENNATHDYLVNTYTVKRDTKYVLVAIEKKFFKTRRKERQQKMKEQEEAKKEVKPTEEISAHVRSADYVIVKETDSKPRTVLLEGREDDTTINTLATAVIPQDVTGMVVQNYVLETDMLEVRDLYVKS